MCRCPDSKTRLGDPCENHCPQELNHQRYFAQNLPAPCGCTPITKQPGRIRRALTRKDRHGPAQPDH